MTHRGDARAAQRGRRVDRANPSRGVRATYRGALEHLVSTEVAAVDVRAADLRLAVDPPGALASHPAVRHARSASCGRTPSYRVDDLLVARCSGRGSRRALRGSPRRSDWDHARAGRRPRPRRAPACRTRIAPRRRRGSASCTGCRTPLGERLDRAHVPRRPPGPAGRGTSTRARRRARPCRNRTRPPRRRSSSR